MFAALIIHICGKSRKVRFCLSLLHVCLITGGLKCSNLLLFDWAAQLCSIMFYCLTNYNPHWEHMESNGVKLPLPTRRLTNVSDPM